MEIKIFVMPPENAELSCSIEKSCLGKQAWRSGDIVDLAADRNAVYLNALSGETVCGIAGMYVAAGEAQIINIAVSEGYRKKGIGSALIYELKKFAAEKNARKIFLEVAENNEAAINLYKKNGFIINGRRKGFYANCDALLMEAVL